MICVLTTDDWFQAHILCGLLTSAGIPAQVFDEGMARMNWLQANAIGGYRLMVPPEDLGAARELLQDVGREDSSDTEETPCPACGQSGTRRLASTSRRVGFLSIGLLGFPLPTGPAPDQVVCATCGAPSPA